MKNRIKTFTEYLNENEHLNEVKSIMDFDSVKIGSFGENIYNEKLKIVAKGTGYKELEKADKKYPTVNFEPLKYWDLDDYGLDKSDIETFEWVIVEEHSKLENMDYVWYMYDTAGVAVYESTNFINESFKAEFFKELSTNQKFKNVLKSRYKYTIAWDKIQDSDLIEMTPRDALKLTKSRSNNTIVFWFDESDVLLGTSCSDWLAPDSTYIFTSSRRPSKPLYGTITTISRASTKAIVIDPNSMERLSTKELRSERWNSKQDAVAFKYAYTIAEENRKRYSDIIATNKVKNKIPDFKIYYDKIEEINVKYQEIFTELIGSPDWHKISQLSDRYSSLLKLFKDFVWSVEYYESKQGSISKYEQDDFFKMANKIEEIYQQIVQENNEQK